MAEIMQGVEAPKSLIGKGKLDGEPVIYAGNNVNTNQPAVWIINKFGKSMPLDITRAREFVNKPGRMYDYAKEDDVPNFPKETIKPSDPGKTPTAQMNANTNLTGSQVQEMYEKGVEVEVSTLSWNEVRELAKENGIPSHQRSRADLEEELRDKNLI